MKARPATLLMLVTLAAACCRSVAGPPCEQVTSYDECEQLAHCSTTQVIFDKGYTGPSWSCVPRDNR